MQQLQLRIQTYIPQPATKESKRVWKKRAGKRVREWLQESRWNGSREVTIRYRGNALTVGRVKKDKVLLFNRNESYWIEATTTNTFKYT